MLRPLTMIKICSHRDQSGSRSIGIKRKFCRRILCSRACFYLRNFIRLRRLIFTLIRKHPRSSQASSQLPMIRSELRLVETYEESREQNDLQGQSSKISRSKIAIDACVQPLQGTWDLNCSISWHIPLVPHPFVLFDRSFPWFVHRFVRPCRSAGAITSSAPSHPSKRWLFFYYAAGRVINFDERWADPAPTKKSFLSFRI